MARFAVFVSAWIWAASVYGQSIDLEEAYPLSEKPTTISVTDADGPASGAVVVVTYRPNSRTVSTEVLPATDSRGQVRWTPSSAGIVNLAAHKSDKDGELIDSLSASVRFGGFPPSGLAVMLAAGILLFGGACLGLVMLFREGQVPAPDPPST